ncbi:MAG: hypothetical protein NT141_04025 [candidate division WWE3 bacterium]|nr:hypothetical protein [candidate division WWE3 bacterium]
MPPWLASNRGIISNVYKIMEVVFGNFLKALSLPSVYQFFGANLVAAVPSLHAGYAAVCFLVVNVPSFRKPRKLLD